MKYALVDGIKTEATPKAQGKCLCCGAEVIAKCGEKRAWHWAHKNNEECNYSKKEPKTQWHLDWQNYFPKEWQEVRCTDEQTGKIHSGGREADRPNRRYDCFFPPSPA